VALALRGGDRTKKLKRLPAEKDAAAAKYKLRRIERLAAVFGEQASTPAAVLSRNPENSLELGKRFAEEDTHVPNRFGVA
jgi:hypothetical protein